MKIEELRKGNFSFGNGLDNPDGMRLVFDITAQGAATTFNINEKFQGWPGVAHGGIVATALDEAMGHAVGGFSQSYSMTVELEIFYLAPVPTGQDLKLAGQVMERVDERRLRAIGEIRQIQNNDLLAHATGLYITVKGRDKEVENT